VVSVQLGRGEDLRWVDVATLFAKTVESRLEPEGSHARCVGERHDQ
jgi:hypothetical protein